MRVPLSAGRMGASLPVRGLALRKETRSRTGSRANPSNTSCSTHQQYTYRVFVTDMSDPIDFVVWFYRQRGGAENLIKEANNDAGLGGASVRPLDVNCNHFQLAMLAYNLNCWLMLFNRERAGRRRRTEAHDAGDLAAPLPVCGGQDLAPRRPRLGELQRSLRGRRDASRGSWIGCVRLRRRATGTRLCWRRPSGSERSACIDSYARRVSRENNLQRKAAFQNNFSRDWGSAVGTLSPLGTCANGQVACII